MDRNELHEGNRAAWDLTARGGYGADIEGDVALLRKGGTNLMPQELRLLGDLEPWCRRAIHLQCSHGLDTLSLWKLGAEEVVGIDISEEMLGYARQKSGLLEAPAIWIRADVLDAPHELDGTADLVHTGRGAICWMTDLDAWASVVFRLLRPGGTFFIFEGHPLDFLWDEESDRFELRREASYFQSAPGRELGFPYAAAQRTEPGAEVRLTSKVWTLGQVITFLIRAGLEIRHVEEFPEPFWDQFKRIPPEQFCKLPHTFAILARKPRLS